MKRLHLVCFLWMVCVPRIAQSFRTSRTALLASPRFRSRQTPILLPFWPLNAASKSLSSNATTSTSNPTLDWKGASHSTSEFVTHVLITSDAAAVAPNQTIGTAVEHVLREKRQQDDVNHYNDNDSLLTAQELLEMGSVWFLPASAPKDPKLGTKPSRLTRHQYTQLLQEGDYLRVHHHPRRFKSVYDYDWSKRIDDTSNSTSHKPGVIVEEDASKGWLVIDKPARVPVHMTVDNCLENVQACLTAARQKDSEEKVYVTTPQRLDQNTSGLFVVATSPAFAAYFAKLLRNKTALQLRDDNQVDDKRKDRLVVGSVHKIYKCLVCIQPPPMSDDAQYWSVGQAWGELNACAKNGTIIRHYLEPSIRAPKRFVTEVPTDSSDKEAWLESLLRIKSVGELCTLVGNDPSEDLAKALWGPSEKNEISQCTGPPPRMPKQCQAITEIQVELLTGRTHQVRGQLAAMGYALVGDIQYGGAQVFEEGEAFRSFSYERLALQCSELEFVDPDVVQDENGVVTLKRSKRWNKFRLNRAWWTESLDAYRDATQSLGDDSSATTNAASDIGLVSAPTSASLGSTKSYSSTSSNAAKPPRPDLLPDRVQLSPGKNKYVLVRASHPLEPGVVHWFVKSAAPAECGGPYHGNVAQDLREWIEAAGYDVRVTGGGRIDYSPSQGRCIVYGFSYGFGKGNHALAARIIQEETNGEIPATFDNTDGLY